MRRNHNFLSIFMVGCWLSRHSLLTSGSWGTPRLVFGVVASIYARFLGIGLSSYKKHFSKSSQIWYHRRTKRRTLAHIFYRVKSLFDRLTLHIASSAESNQNETYSRVNFSCFQIFVNTKQKFKQAFICCVRDLTKSRFLKILSKQSLRTRFPSAA